MGSLIWLGLRAFVFSLILTPIIRDIFRVFELVDRPDSSRKTHAYPIPRVGGIAVLISYRPKISISSNGAVTSSWS